MFCVWNAAKAARRDNLAHPSHCCSEFRARGEYKSNVDVTLMREMTEWEF